MDLNGVEDIDLNALGGADTITVNNLAATDVHHLNLDLNDNTGTGFGQADAVIINGTDGNDAIQIGAFDNGTRISAVVGTSLSVDILGAEGVNDTLTVNALGGNDVVDASGLSANLIGLTLNGGAGNDTLIGSQGDDLVNGGAGADLAQLGDGNDTFVWNPGDGSDTVEGQGGFDRMVFNGSDGAEKFALSANGSRLRFTRDVGTITMDLNDIEVIDVNALGGADTVTINDTSSTGLATVDLNLQSAAGTGDGQPDAVVINGTNRADTVQIVVRGDGTTITVSGLAPQVNINGAEGANDTLTVNTLGGNDAVDASGLPANLIGLTVNLGTGQGDANTRFVEQLYQDLLGRQADAAGLATWLAALDRGLTRAQVAAAIENSMEFQADLVQKAFQQFLHRDADPAGLNAWVAFLQQGHTVEEMEAGILGSPEYFQVRGGGTNDGFLAAIYQDVLGRGIDAPGQAAFDMALANRATAGQVATAVLGSLEGLQDAVQGFYRNLLGRPADAAGLNGFVSGMQQGLTDQQVIAAIAGSDEFFANL
jgi:hypothetical protein